MSRRWQLGLAIYAVLIGSLLTPLYEPLTTGRDDSWATVVAACAAHIGVGAAVARAWVLLLPVVFGLVAFVVDGAEGLSVLILVFAIPAGLVAAGLGWGGAAVLPRHAPVVATAAFVCALVPFVWASVETAQRVTAPHVPDDVQAQLPTDESLGNLCPGAETPRKVTRRLERQAEALIRELRRHPSWLVSYVYYYSDDPPERKDITVRELAEEQLHDLDIDGHCAQGVQRRIRDALD